MPSLRREQFHYEDYESRLLGSLVFTASSLPFTMKIENRK